MISTIHYISDILYFSSASGRYATKTDAIRHHIKYLRKNAHAMLGSEENIINIAKKIDTRVDARVAMKFCIAVPNDITEKNQWMEMTRKFFSEILDLPEENFFLVLHENHNLGKELGTQNIHIHIVANTVTNQGKKIRLGKSDLSKIHKEWDIFLERNGYKIRREKKGESIGKIGWAQMKDPNVKLQYKEYLKTQKQIEEVEMKISVQKDRDTKQYPTEFEEKEISVIDDIVKKRYYSNIIWEGGKRNNQNAKEITAVIFDIDGTETIEEVMKKLNEKKIQAYIVTTKSHTPEKHHFRIIFETKDTVTKDLRFYRDACNFLAEELDIRVDNTFDLARMYAPSTDNAQIIHIQGKPLDFMEYIKRARQKQKSMEQTAIQEKIQRNKIKTTTQDMSNWLYADVQGMMQISIKELIKHFEGIDREWKAGNETYIRTLEKEKIAINENENVAFSFKKMQGYGVLRYLSEKTGEKNLNNLARTLEKLGFGSFLVINEKVFDEKFNNALVKSADISDFVENLKEEFHVKSVFIDYNKSTIKIAGIEKDINLDYILQAMKTLKENKKYDLKR